MEVESSDIKFLDKGILEGHKGPVTSIVAGKNLASTGAE